MLWSVFLSVSAACFFLSVVIAFIRSRIKYKTGMIIDPTKIVLIGLAVAAFVLYIPLYLVEFKNSDCGWFESILFSFHNTIRLFVVDAEYDFVFKNLYGMSDFVYRAYTVFFSVFFVLAPILTFGFVLSFFKNLSAHRRYITHFFSETFVFSELNDKSLALAKSLYNNGCRKRFFVFTDVFSGNEEESYELIEKAKEIGAICFKKDILTINFGIHSRSLKRGLNFFMIDSNQSQNTTQALKLFEKYKYRKNAKVYVFSTQVESEILLSNAFNSETKEKPYHIKVRRINEKRSLIMRNLYDCGFERIFKSAYDDGTGIKKINALIVGMDQCGTEMTKALAWFCQMDGYLAEINSFDEDEFAEQKFISEYPELMAMSGKLDIEGESKYTINIHSDINVDSIAFDNEISKLPRTTYVLVALGNDEKNIATAVKLRAMFLRMGYAPEIQAIVTNSEKKEALLNATNFKGQQYNIDFIGDIKSSYSEEAILNSEVENVALERHKKWGDERSFWRYDYNFKSSLASAIHRKMKSLCNIPGIDKPPIERTEEELWNIRILEHNRWNAYMRSEGYVYGGTTDSSGRNDLAKTHNCLVPFNQLPLEEQIKDDN